MVEKMKNILLILFKYSAMLAIKKNKMSELIYELYLIGEGNERKKINRYFQNNDSQEGLYKKLTWETWR